MIFQEEHLVLPVRHPRPPLARLAVASEPPSGPTPTVGTAAVPTLSHEPLQHLHLPLHLVPQLVQLIALGCRHLCQQLNWLCRWCVPKGWTWPTGIQHQDCRWSHSDKRQKWNNNYQVENNHLWHFQWLCTGQLSWSIIFLIICATIWHKIHFYGYGNNTQWFFMSLLPNEWTDHLILTSQKPNIFFFWRNNNCNLIVLSLVIWTEGIKYQSFPRKIANYLSQLIFRPTKKS